MANEAAMVKDARMSDLPPIRNPNELDMDLSAESVDRYKNWDCRFYEKCLDDAANRAWHQFHCQNCGAYASPAIDLLEIIMNRRSRKTSTL